MGKIKILSSRLILMEVHFEKFCPYFLKLLSHLSPGSPALNFNLKTWKWIRFPLDYHFTTVPRFLRFRNVLIDLLHSYMASKSIPMAKRCKLLLMTMLRQFSSALQGCSLTFKSEIFPSCASLIFFKHCRFGCHFKNYTDHLAYIRDKLIPSLFDRCSSYNFETDIVEPKCHLAHPIGSIDIAGLLAIDSIKKCSDVKIQQNGGMWVECRAPAIQFLTRKSCNSVCQK